MGIKCMQSSNGFTLAEVLVTFAVIGVIAALTIPGLLKNHQNQVTVTKLKKAFSVLSQATMMINADCDGNVLNCLSDPNAANNDAPTTTEIANLYKAKLSYIKDCGISGTGCFGNVMYKYLDGTDYINWTTRTDRHKLLLNDGVAINVNWDGPTYEYKAFRGDIDVNGPNPPNQLGRDIFTFLYNKNTGMLEPMGANYNREGGSCTSSDQKEMS